MSIPFNDALMWKGYRSNPDHYKNQPPAGAATESLPENQVKRAASELIPKTLIRAGRRSVQLIRDVARLVLKVPVRSVWTPIVLPKNWKQRKRAKINAKLAAYSFVQLVSVPAKFLVALAALTTAAFSYEKAEWLLDKSVAYTAHLDGRASQLEALKEEGLKEAKDLEEYNQYKTWLYGISPELCRKPS
jgi:hypothetical protein